LSVLADVDARGDVHEAGLLDAVTGAEIDLARANGTKSRCGPVIIPGNNALLACSADGRRHGLRYVEVGRDLQEDGGSSENDSGRGAHGWCCVGAIMSRNGWNFWKGVKRESEVTWASESGCLFDVDDESLQGAFVEWTGWDGAFCWLHVFISSFSHVCLR